jgi:hypothetical protein
VKYVMFKKKMDQTTHFVPVIFGESIAHIEVAEALLKDALKGYEVHSAGDLSSMSFTGDVGGESTTLKVSSDPDDERRISMSDYSSFE